MCTKYKAACDFVFQLSNFLAILNAHCVDPEIIKQIFRQVSQIFLCLLPTCCSLLYSYLCIFSNEFSDLKQQLKAL